MFLKTCKTTISEKLNLELKEIVNTYTLVIWNG